MISQNPKLSYFLLYFLVCSTVQSQNVSNQKNDSGYPDWVKDAVFYQIFPERFHNGDPSNDPVIADLNGAWPHDEISEWQISPWTSDWYKLQEWEEKNGRGFYYNSQLRRYGGDLQGVIDKLDYLADLGITAIYFNPLFESPSLHKYDAALYHHIDDNFGPDPAHDHEIIGLEDFSDPATWQWTTADQLFLDLIRKAHERNIKIIIDGVFNHVGIRFWAFEDVKIRGRDSQFKDWFIIKRWDNPDTAQDEFDYAGWVGVKDLPEFREDENGLVRGPREHVFAIVRRWMDPDGDGDPSDGIDGWRLDVAEKVAHKFWQDFRKLVKKINPDAYITAELFWDDWQNNILMDPAPWLKGDQFDGVMNYRWASVVTRFFVDHKNRISATEFARKLENQWKQFPDKTNFILQNLLDSHDTDRIASNIVNPDLVYDKLISPKDNKKYNVRKQDSGEREILKLIAMFQMGFAGAPMIYYGTEAGMWGADDPDDRKPMLWPDMEFEDEMHHPFDAARPVDPVSFDHDLFEYYRKIIGIRKNHAVFRTGSWKFLVADDQKDIVVIMREYQGRTGLLVINNSPNANQISIPLKSKSAKLFTDLITEKQFKIVDNVLSLNIKGKNGGFFLSVD